MSLKGVNNEQNIADPVTFADFAATAGGAFENEGIITGVHFSETSPASTSVDYTAGKIAIGLESGEIAVFYTEAGTLAVTDNTAGVYNLAVLKIDTSAATSTVEMLAGTASTDPTLSETTTVKYIELARIIGTGGNVTNSDIVQDNKTVTNNADSNIIGKVASVGNRIKLSSSWSTIYSTFTYAAADDPTYTMTVSGDYTEELTVGTKIKISQSGTKYFIVSKDATVASNVTTVTIYGGSNYDLAASTISSVEISREKAPKGFPFTGWTWDLAALFVSQVSPASNTWYYSGATLDFPIGVWFATFNFRIAANNGSSSDSSTAALAGMSTSNTGTPDLFSVDGINVDLAGTGGSGINIAGTAGYALELDLSSKTSYYLGVRENAIIGEPDGISASVNQIILLPIFL